MKFAFENLEVYQRSLVLAERIEVLCRQLKGKATYSFLDQLSRASMSVPLNIAEGNGRWHKNEKKQFFWIARGSVFEIVPILEMAKNKALIPNSDFDSYYKELQDLSIMLLRLVQSVERLQDA